MTTGRGVGQKVLERRARVWAIAASVAVVAMVAGSCSGSDATAPPSTTPSTGTASSAGAASGPGGTAVVRSLSAEQLDKLTAFERADAALVLQLHGEAMFSAMFTASGGADTYRPQLAGQRSSTDGAIDDYHAAIAGVASPSASFTDAGAKVTDRLKGLAATRQGVDDVSIDALAAVDQLDTVAGDVEQHGRSILRDVDDPRVFRGLTAAANLVQVLGKEADTAAILSIAVVVGFYPGQLPSGATRAATAVACDPDPSAAGARCPVYQRAINANNAFARAEQLFDETASGAQKQTKRSADAGVQLDQLKKTALEDGQGKNDLTGAKDGVKVDPLTFVQAASDRLRRLVQAHETVLAAIVTDAADAAPSAPLTHDQLAQVVAFDRANAELVRRFENEGLVSAAFAASGATVPKDALVAARDQSDRAITDYRNALAAVSVGAPAFRDAGKQADNRLKQFRTIRNSVDGVQNDALGLAEQYFSAASDLISQSRALALGVDDPHVFRPLLAHADLLELQAAQARVATLLVIPAQVGFYAAQLPGGSVKTAGNPVVGNPAQNLGCNPDPSSAGDRCKVYRNAVDAMTSLAAADAVFDASSPAPEVEQAKHDADAADRLAPMTRTAIDDGTGKNDLTGTSGGTKVDPVAYADAAQQRLDALAGVGNKILDLLSS